MKEKLIESGRGYSLSQCDHFRAELTRLRDAEPRVQIDLSHLAGQLKVERARTFANEGLGRRLPLIGRAVQNIYSIYPPDRAEFLTRDECNDVAIQLHAFAINLSAIFDNIAWINMLEADGSLPPTSVSAFRKECQQFFPPRLVRYLNQTQTRAWHQEYGKLYRDSTAHRIAPYLPSRAYTQDEGEHWKRLHAQSHNALLSAAKAASARESAAAALDENERLNVEKEALGTNSLIIALSLTADDKGPLIYLHPQLLCDWAMSHELVSEFTLAVREAHGLMVPQLPSFTVR